MTDRANSSLSLHQLLTDVNDAIRASMPSSYWVRAEILQISHKRHWYIELCSYDDGAKAKARAVIWQQQSDIVENFEKSSGMQLAKGVKVMVRMDVGYHPEYGLQLTIKELDPKFSLGDMEAQLNLIRQRLEELGELQLNRQLEPPKDFIRVAVISPSEAAGLGDFRSQADAMSQYGLCEFEYYPALFQGADCQNSIVNAFSQALKDHKNNPVDAIVVIRGGGDKAGLYELNAAKIARCVCRSPAPVYVGIGHDRDSTILDELANRSFPTPSLVVSHIKRTVVDNARQSSKYWQSFQQNSQRLTDLARSNARQQHERMLRQGFDRVRDARKLVDGAYKQLRVDPIELLQESRQDLERMKAACLNEARQTLVQEQSAVNDNLNRLQRHSLESVQEARKLVRAAEQQVRVGPMKNINAAKQTAKELLLSLKHDTKRGIEKEASRLLRIRTRIVTSAQTLLQKSKSEIDKMNFEVRARNPEKILEQGFSLVLSEAGKPITERSQLASGQQVKVKFRDGASGATINEIEDD